MSFLLPRRRCRRAGVVDVSLDPDWPASAGQGPAIRDHSVVAPEGRDKRSGIADLCRQAQLKDAYPRSLAMNSSKLQEHVDVANAHATRERDATARQAAYIEALARDGHDAATARKLLRAFEEMEALHRADSARRTWGLPS